MAELRKRKLFRLWLVSYTCIFMIPILLCAALLHRTVSLSTQKLEEAGGILLDKYSSQTDIILREADIAVIKLAYNAYVQQCAESDHYYNTDGIMAAYKLKPVLSEMNSTYSSIQAMFIHFPASSSILAESGRVQADGESRDSIVSLGIDSEGQVLLLERDSGCYIMETPSGVKIMFAKRRLSIPTARGRSLADVIIRLDDSTLTFDNISLKSIGASAYITDSAGGAYPTPMPDDTAGYLHLTRPWPLRG